METQILENAGFTSAESKVYLCLLKLGKTKSGKVIKQTGLQSSVVHNSLNTLIEKGFVKYILEGKLKTYLALNPELIGYQLENKKKEFFNHLAELKNLQNTFQNQTIAEVYEGYKGLYAATLDLINDVSKGSEFKYFAAGNSILKDDALEFFSKVDMLKKEKGISVRGIANITQKKVLQNYKSSEIRYTSLEIPPALNICQDKILIMSLSDRPAGILIKSKEIAEQYHQLWNDLWRKSQKRV